MAKSGQVKNKQSHSAHHTQWAAQFAVASELCKQGYQVALTMGNHPVVDLMVVSPNDIQFLVDVKGLHERNFWLVREREKMHDNLFYVFAFVPKDAQNQFFILTESQVNEGIQADWERAKARRKAKGLSGEPADLKGVEWEFAERHNGGWEALPK